MFTPVQLFINSKHDLDTFCYRGCKKVFLGYYLLMQLKLSYIRSKLKCMLGLYADSCRDESRLHHGCFKGERNVNQFSSLQALKSYSCISIAPSSVDIASLMLQSLLYV